MYAKYHDLTTLIIDSTCKYILDLKLLTLPLYNILSEEDNNMPFKALMIKYVGILQISYITNYLSLLF